MPATFGDTMAPIINPEDTELARWFKDEVLVLEESLRSFLRHAFPSVSEAEDIVQETFARVLKARQAGTVQNTRAYVFATARNGALDVLRRRKIIAIDSIAEISQLPVANDEPGVPDQVDAALNLDVLNEAIQSLPERCREVLVLRKLHGLSQRDIAARLGIAEHTVEAQVYNGMRRCTDFFRRRGLLEERER